MENSERNEKVDKIMVLSKEIAKELKTQLGSAAERKTVLDNVSNMLKEDAMELINEIGKSLENAKMELETYNS